jgi:hypothetical protein
MAKVQTGKTDEKVDPKAKPAKTDAKVKAEAKTPANATPAKDKKVKTATFKSKVEKAIMDSGKEGTTAEAIAKKLKLINKDTEKADRQTQLKKVRTSARQILGGKSTQQDGRSAVYIHPTA